MIETTGILLAEKKMDKNEMLIVGIGASAGGVPALIEFFENVPAVSGMAYVVILHLSPDHDTELANILQRSTTLTVTRVTQKMQLQPDNVYMIPHNQHVMMDDRHLVVSANIYVEERRAPIDIFFRTLADTQGPKAVCVVLSGTGANGSMGLKRVKELGGAVFVQNPREAEFNEMPRNAISTDLVDEVLPVAQIPGKILLYKQNMGTVLISEDPDKRPEAQQQALREVFLQLKLRTGHDFSDYKRPTIMRRIERRINIRNLPDLPAYAAYIQQDMDEAFALLKDLLISVTNFFRDKKAWEVIEQDIVPRLLHDKTSEHQVRIWVAGCATGEEAYSIAMLCAEKIQDMIDPPKLQVFATDLDETAIAHARDGLYTLNDAADISPERLRRFFSKEGDAYRIRREIRETIMFAHHNFIKDPPFSHLDLITCRNVLIYFNRAAQERVAQTFHFALNTHGFLFLGSSETVDASADLYSAFHREQHVYQSRQAKTRFYPVPESVPLLNTDKLKIQVPQAKEEILFDKPSSYGELHHRLLEGYAPPSIITDLQYEILHITERAGRYLQVGGGEPSQNLLKLIRPEMRLELRSALFQAIEQKKHVTATRLKVGMEGSLEAVDLHIKPVLHGSADGEGYLLILFEPAETDVEEKEGLVMTRDEPVTKHLEEELIRMKAQLQKTIEKYEFQGEELKASNEELQAMNEELRSAAEELETSKEELQSINEELTTVNQELKIKIEETSVSSNNLQNLLNSADIATIFLDRNLRVALFTPAIRDIFNLIGSDLGRPITDITNRLASIDITEVAEKVLENLRAIELEVSSSDERHFLMRLLPYRTIEDRINGVVITFVDITARKVAEDALKESERLLKESLGNLAADLAGMTRLYNLNERLLNGGSLQVILQEILAVAIDFMEMDRGNIQLVEPVHKISIAVQQKHGQVFLGRFKNATLPAIWEKVITKKEQLIIEDISTTALIDNALDLETIAGEGIRALQSTPIINRKGTVLGIITTYNQTSQQPTATGLKLLDLLAWMAADFIEKALSDEALKKSEQRVRTLSDAVPQVIWANDSAGKANYFNKRWYDYSGLDFEESFGLGWEAIVHPEDAAASVATWQAAKLAGKVFDAEYRLKRADGVYRWHIGRNVPQFDTNGMLTEWFGSATDIEELKATQESLQESRELLRVTMESTTDFAIITIDNQGSILGWNNGATHLFGYTEGEVLNRSLDIIFTTEDQLDDMARKERIEARAHGKALDERWHVRKDGTRLFMSGVMAPLQKGHFGGFVKIARDVTDRKGMEELKDEFIGIASHELKTPVTSIKAYTGLLHQIFIEKGNTQETTLISKMEHQVDRLIKLITELLDTSRISEGQLMLKLEDADLNALIADIVEELQRLSSKHPISFVRAGLPFVSIDKERIQQVILNLLSNAIKYSPDGGEIIILSEDIGTGIRITVSDNGIGISKEMQERVFDRFFRVSNPEMHTISGMGLGLYITAGIIQKHGGSITVESEGNGSKFIFVLPYRALTG